MAGDGKECAVVVVRKKGKLEKKEKRETETQSQKNDEGKREGWRGGSIDGI